MSSEATILGQAGERLATLSGPLHEPTDAGAQELGLEQEGDVAALGERLSPELRAWDALQPGLRLRGSRRAHWTPPCTAQLFPAVQARDAIRWTRLQAIFLPVSTVRVQREAYTTASWHATRHGTSRVYISHKSEPGLWRRHASLSGWVARTVAEWRRADVDGATREAYRRADAAQLAADDEVFPPHLDPEVLQVRTRWVAHLLLGAESTRHDPPGGHYDRLEGMPSYADYLAERELVATWPHLQAYWLVHHMLLRNREAQDAVLAVADDRYPPIRELRAIAAAFDAGQEPSQLVGHGRHQALRWDLVTAASPAMHTDAVAAVEREFGTRDRWLTETELARVAIAGGGSDDARKGLAAWDLLCQSAGRLGEAEEALLSALSDEQERERLRVRTASGETSPLVEPLRVLLETADPSWGPMFEAAFMAGATLDEEHPDAAPGALVGWGKALGSFADLHRRVQAVCRSLGPRRNLELALVADHFYDEPQAQAFLLEQMVDFVPTLGREERGITSFAGFALLRRRHPEALGLANAFMASGPLTDATWPVLVALVDRAAAWGLAELESGLQALVRRGFGRHDDGTRGLVFGVWAGLAGAEAVPWLEVHEATSDADRPACESAAVWGAILAVRPDHPAAKSRLRRLLGALAMDDDADAVGASVVLLQALQKAGSRRVPELARRLRRETTAGHPWQRRWLDEVGGPDDRP